jgi:AcrR family transcriptional regulator
MSPLGTMCHDLPVLSRCDNRRTTKKTPGVVRMTSDWQRQRKTFRHGSVPEALLDAALKRLQTEEASSLKLRELARDVGIDHRAVYRHYADKLALIAAIAEHAWRRLGEDMTAAAKDRPAGEETLIACGVRFFFFAKDNPNLFHLMSGSRLNTSGSFPGLEMRMFEALYIFQHGFEQFGQERNEARARAAIYASALQGVSTQILYKRLRLSTRRAPAEMANICRMLIKGLR